MSSKENVFRINIIAPKKARMGSDDDGDEEEDDDDTAQHPVDELKRKRKLDDCTTGSKLEEKLMSVDATIDTASQIRNEHEVLNDKEKPLIAPTSNNPERNNFCTIQNKKINDKLNYANDANDYLKNKRIHSPEPNESNYGNDNTSKYDQICNENSVDKIFSNSSRPKKSFQNSSDRINYLNNSSEEESSNHENNLVSDTKTVIRVDSSLINDSSSAAMTFQKSKIETNLVDDSDINISESNTINKFNSDPCHSESTDINTLNENPTNDQEQFQMSFKNQTSELNCISLFTEDERDAIAKLIIDSNLINNEMENLMFPENSKGIYNRSNDFKENIIRSDDESESDLDEKDIENSENCNLLQNNSEIHNAHGSEIQSDDVNNIMDTNEEINLNDEQMTDFSPLSTNVFENLIPDLPVSRSSSRQESPLNDTNIDLDEIHDTDSTSDLLESELTTDESQSSIDTRIVQPQIATSTNKAPVVNVLRLEILTNSLNESSSDEQYKAQRTIHVIENEAHMIKLQKLLYNPNPQYFEGVDRFNLIQGTIPDIIKVLKAYPDSTHHAHVRIFNPDQERYKNTVSNTYIKNNSSKRSYGDCAICMYTLFNPVSTWCGHIFCENCLLHSIEYNRECPSCRKHLSIPYYHKVFI